MKDTDHHRVHPFVHFRCLRSVARTESFALRELDFGRGQNTVLGWSDPTFAHDSVAKVMLGVAPAQHNFCRCLARVRGRILDEIGEVKGD